MFQHQSTPIGREEVEPKYAILAIGADVAGIKASSGTVFSVPQEDMPAEVWAEIQTSAGDTVLATPVEVTRAPGLQEASNSTQFVVRSLKTGTTGRGLILNVSPERVRSGGSGPARPGR
ncbi:hypothetical protein GCM10022223_17870 [Kineosporia mesophila]|uniref:Uncharacterized protein n=1 Tax=Kineosporia mesophila TaxID=566012 RepID=A0ABP6ZCY9_9ACTN|nr:hypothetical protein [Kineosporia mesophila]MCD5351976.1 hypothetical protein [Kineosporia mesophila]